MTRLVIMTTKENMDYHSMINTGRRTRRPTKDISLYSPVIIISAGLEQFNQGRTTNRLVLWEWICESSPKKITIDT